MASGSGSADPPYQKVVEEVTALRRDLNDANSRLETARQEIVQLRTRASSTTNNTGRAKANKPHAFNGRSKDIESWASCMDAYVIEEAPDRALTVAASYLEKDAHVWYTTFKKTTTVNTWPELRAALISRFNPLNKTLAARDKLSKWKQMKDVASFNSDFLQIILDIPEITEAEKIDRYCRGLKNSIWEVLCTKEYERVEDVMTDALRVEAAKKGSRNLGNPTGSSRGQSFSGGTDGPAPMELGATHLVKLTPEERERCFREGRCLRCREKGHLAKECPKARGQRTPRA